ncbi:PREDICTED: BTB/POZ domain-containing protein At3g05675-like [Camelina sativa]|uniref:BTB/POZ domain-containing protein At3g05675-like n=1 Tax=Camelina sativa TaxID=90675 RepID=A0ABM0T7F5_CAMSA|nr:PREDICTED: BTB/POZ domain-containing protein At3g05675-like [Camelina sativa]
MQEAASDVSLDTKNVFSSALRFAMSIDTLKNSPELVDELKTSAQEQVEFMLSEDEEVRLLISEEDVKSVVRLGISNVISMLLDRLSSLLICLPVPECPEFGVLKTLYDIEWLCKVLPRMELMKDLVFKWADVSSEILMIAQNCKLDSQILGVKVKLVEVTGKILEAVGYGIVIVPSKSRTCLLKIWLPFIRRLKTLVDAEGNKSECRMDEDLCEFIEGSMVSLVLTLPSNDQAEVFGEWMRGIGLEGVKFPDLSEAFEVWCYRSKSAKRRLLEKCDRLASETLDL